MAAGNRWTGSIGIFEYETDNHDTYDDDDWLDDNFATPEYIGLDMYTDGTDCIQLLVTEYVFSTDPKFTMSILPARTNIRIATGSSQVIITFTCLIYDDMLDIDGAAQKLETHLKNLSTFINSHDASADKDIYLVWRRDVGGTFYYNEFETGTPGTYKKYLKCAIDIGTPTYISYGVAEVTVQILEVT